ncbi:MAG: hypothetical protein M3O15_11955 [Acidobacteriota bacterium]|nr:hypothetical protein [Acidobacteriota bacterium]
MPKVSASNGAAIPRRAARPISGLAVLMLIVALFAGSGASWAGSPVTVGNGVTVSVSQLNFLADSSAGSPDDNSPVGVASFSFDSTATQLVGPNGGAYLNLYTSTDGISYQWEIQNYFVQFDTSAEMLATVPTVQFDLGVPDGTPLSSISFQVSLASTATGSSSPSSPPPPPANPTPTQPSPGHFTTATAPLGTSSATLNPGAIDQKQALPLPDQPVYSASVTPQNYRVGGFNGGGSGARPQVGQWGGGANFAPRPVAWGAAAINQIPTVNEDNMGCAPAGIARSIRYMLNLKGAGGPTAQNIYNGLYGAMGTGANGTTGPNMVNGKANWAAANGYRINTGFVNAGQAMNILANGGDVEINISWPGGGHVAMITQIVRYADGSYQVSYIDDPVQGDGQAANQVHSYRVAANGQILGTNAWISGLLGETM